MHHDTSHHDLHDHLHLHRGQHDDRSAGTGDRDGTIRNHKLKLTFKHLHRGRYHLTLAELQPHKKPLVIGHTTLTVA